MVSPSLPHDNKSVVACRMNISALEVPKDPCCFNQTTGLVHCIARREGGNRNKKMVFYVESGNLQKPALPLLIAQKQKDGKFYIFAISEHDHYTNRNFRKETFHYIGKIRRTRIPKSKLIVSSLFVGTKEEKEQISSLVYDSVSLRHPVVDGFPDRLVYSVVKTKVGAKNHHSANEHVKGHPTLASCPGIDDAICFHPNHISEIGDLYSGLQVFRSRHRIESSSKHQEPFLVRFRGRGGRSSQKNLQIVEPSTGEIVFQMARWNQDEFTVDFKDPYTACQAFAIALAQLEA